ncbi:ribokinase [Oscillibacter sp. MSJ-2]|uniref:Ribokinase n=1 Tax=Dysosmobacter acutus TaxID=2841504 RepID=A0ABS6FA88_9FIRM|nr:ribokinase [Dysosmobacter acutus]MBU5626467.1 ribokinase [Dysosmobacter acutus]
MLRKPKILVVGSFVMDLIASTEKAPNSGETVIGKSFRTAPGGKGANQAVQCARLGAHVTMVGQVGGDSFGQEMVDTARAAGVDISHVLVDKEVSSGVGHILLEVTEHGAQNRITVIPGANYTLKTADVAWLKDEIGRYDLLMMQLELPMDVTCAVASYAKAAGVPLMLNPAPAAPLPEELLSCVTYLSPNEHEAAAITGLPLRADETGVNEEDMKRVAAALREKGVENVIITLGGNGSAVAGVDGVHYTACVKMDHVADPTAAGDSFVAAFCTGLTAGLSQDQALNFASHTAAITVSRMGAMPSLPTLEEVRSLMRQRGYQGFDLSELDALN